MNEAVSNSMVFTIVIIIISICSIVVVTSTAYSKTYKIKNRIVEIIEKSGVYDNDVQDEINEFLKDSGYTVTVGNNDRCPAGRSNEETPVGMSDEDVGKVNINTLEAYKYCIYRYKTVKGNYYSVLVYMTFELPLINDLIKVRIPIYGDTKVIADF